LRLLVRYLPIALVSWFSFFLRDTGKRVDLAGDNLLLFIAFNFTIGNELPRLGYVTVVDSVLTGLFVITGTVVLANVMLKRMQNTGRDALLQKLDRFALMAYPLGYLFLIGAIAAMLIWH
jgi:L-lactate permease